MIFVKIKGNRLPFHGSAGSAGYDLAASLDVPVEIQPGETKIIGTGTAMEIPAGYFGQLHGRSSMAIRRGLQLVTGVSVIDSDFRGEIMVGLRNISDEPQIVHDGERIAQIIFQKYDEANYIQVDELTGSGRGSGGIGSTGK